jgi:GT2 family glycosyltransferase
MKVDVSIIIPNFNGEKYIENCLNSVIDQSFNKQGKIEVIVVDDYSTDTSIEMIKRYKTIKLIENSKNSGFAYSVNQGIRSSKGIYCLLLNNDVVVDYEFVEKLFAQIESNQSAFSVSSKMIRYYERELLDDTGDFYNALGWAYKRGDGKKVSDYTKRTKIFSTCAGAGIYRRSILNEIGLLDEAFFAYLEDVDLSYRGKIFGYENYYEPLAICYHIGSATTADGNKYSAFKVRISARNNILLVYKNMPLFQLIINSPLLFIGFCIKYGLFIKRGYGKEYRLGIRGGFKSIKTVTKVSWKVNHFGNYCLIQIQLLINLFRFLGNKLFG